MPPDLRLERPRAQGFCMDRQDLLKFFGLKDGSREKNVLHLESGVGLLAACFSDLIYSRSAYN